MLTGFLQGWERAPGLDGSEEAAELELPWSSVQVPNSSFRGAEFKKVPGFVLHAFRCVSLPVISFSTEKAFSTGKRKKRERKGGGRKKQNQPPTFLAMGCFSKQLIKR